MPREIVKPAADALYYAKVGWDREAGTVQLGVEADDERSLFWMLLGVGSAFTAEQTNERLDALGKVVREIVERNAAVDDGTVGRAALPDHQVGADVLNMLDSFASPSITGVWTDLDRRGCNELIRLLRRARDGAFGRDE